MSREDEYSALDRLAWAKVRGGKGQRRTETCSGCRSDRRLLYCPSARRLGILRVGAQSVLSPRAASPRSSSEPDGVGMEGRGAWLTSQGHLGVLGGGLAELPDLESCAQCSSHVMSSLKPNPTELLKLQVWLALEETDVQGLSPLLLAPSFLSFFKRPNLLFCLVFP